MSEDQHGAGGLRERIASGAEDKLGKALTDLFENPVVSGAIGIAFDAREKAAQAQELAMGALNLPSAADIERLTRRLRSLSQRLEGIEDGVARIDRGTGQRLAAIEGQLNEITTRVETLAAAGSRARAAAESGTAERTQAKPQANAKPKPAGAAKAGGAAQRRGAAKPSSRSER